MGSREKILKGIRQSKQGEVILEAFPFTFVEEQGLTSIFTSSLEGIGGRCTVLENTEALEAFLRAEFPQTALMVNGLEFTTGYNLEAIRSSKARELESVQLAILRGDLGVAENGAVWVTERNMGHRILPFITEQLILVIEERSIVASMHNAYEQLTVNEDGYGVFIAGPSKTADIEQSLVIGAHGPVAMQVLILKDK